MILVIKYCVSFGIENGAKLCFASAWQYFTGFVWWKLYISVSDYKKHNLRLNSWNQFCWQIILFVCFTPGSCVLSVCLDCKRGWCGTSSSSSWSTSEIDRSTRRPRTDSQKRGASNRARRRSLDLDQLRTALRTPHARAEVSARAD